MPVFFLFLFYKKKQAKLKSAMKSKRCACFLKKKILICTKQMVTIINLSLTSDFWVAMINCEHIPRVFHSPIFPACSISRAEVQIRVQQQKRQQQQLEEALESVSWQLHRKLHPSTRWGVTSSILTFPILNLRFLPRVNFKIKFHSCAVAAC